MAKTNWIYSVDVLPEEDGNGFYVVAPALPGCFSQGKTVEGALRNIQEAIGLHIQALKKQGIKIHPEEGTIHTTVEVSA